METALEQDWQIDWLELQLWRAWMDSLDIGADIDDGHGGDILVAEIKGEEDREDLPMLTIGSGMGLPSPAGEDRQVELAPYHEQSKGGSTQSKFEQSVTEGSIPEDRGCSESSAATMPMGHISAVRAELTN